MAAARARMSRCSKVVCAKCCELDIQPQLIALLKNNVWVPDHSGVNRHPVTLDGAISLLRQQRTETSEASDA
jgi:hypothetical protein